MRVSLYGRNLDELRILLRDFPGFQIVKEDPELVIAHGGDGALLGAERDFPGIDKLPLRDRKHNPKCPEHDERQVLQALLDGKLSQTRLEKLEAASPSGMVRGINDVCINKANISSAVRFRLWLDGRLENSQVVGDGLVVSTVFGSTGYYRSITKSTFRTGLGLAFNNSTEPMDHLVVGPETRIEVEILRGPALLLADNAPERIPLRIGDHIRIFREPVTTRVFGLDVFRCRSCFALRACGDCLPRPEEDAAHA